MINNISDLINGIKTLDELPNIAGATEDYSGYKLLQSSNNAALQTLSDTELDLLVEIENSAGFYLLTPDGLLITGAVKRLVKSGIMVAAVAYEGEFFTHVIMGESFAIPFSA